MYATLWTYMRILGNSLAWKWMRVLLHAPARKRRCHLLASSLWLRHAAEIRVRVVGVALGSDQSVHRSVAHMPIPAARRVAALRRGGLALSVCSAARYLGRISITPRA